DFLATREVDHVELRCILLGPQLRERISRICCHDIDRCAGCLFERGDDAGAVRRFIRATEGVDGDRVILREGSRAEQCGKAQNGRTENSFHWSSPLLNWFYQRQEAAAALACVSSRIYRETKSC